MRKVAEIHIKGWGKEEWVVNNDKYCGKILYFNKGKKCSFHKHEIKDEVFRLAKGKMILRGGYDEDIDKAEVFILQEGDIFHIPIGYIHQMEAIEDSELYEFSTTHFEFDSYRIIKGD
jgi:mannose-6-phosphate isomerase-like protein (cupin superfamily)